MLKYLFCLLALLAVAAFAQDCRECKDDFGFEPLCAVTDNGRQSPFFGEPLWAIFEVNDWGKVRGIFNGGSKVYWQELGNRDAAVSFAPMKELDVVVPIESSDFRMDCERSQDASTLSTVAAQYKDGVQLFVAPLDQHEIPDSDELVSLLNLGCGAESPRSVRRLCKPGEEDGTLWKCLSASQLSCIGGEAALAAIQADPAAASVTEDTCGCSPQGDCRSGGVCVCRAGFTGSKCLQIAHDATIENIVPGNAQQDIWHIGTTRSVRFEHTPGSSGQAYTLTAYIVDESNHNALGLDEEWSATPVRKFASYEVASVESTRRGEVSMELQLPASLPVGATYRIVIGSSLGGWWKAKNRFTVQQHTCSIAGDEFNVGFCVSSEDECTTSRPALFEAAANARECGGNGYCCAPRKQAARLESRRNRYIEFYLPENKNYWHVGETVEIAWQVNEDAEMDEEWAGVDKIRIEVWSQLSVSRVGTIATSVPIDQGKIQWTVGDIKNFVGMQTWLEPTKENMGDTYMFRIARSQDVVIYLRPKTYASHWFQVSFGGCSQAASAFGTCMPVDVCNDLERTPKSGSCSGRSNDVMCCVDENRQADQGFRLANGGNDDGEGDDDGGFFSKTTNVLLVAGGAAACCLFALVAVVVVVVVSRRKRRSSPSFGHRRISRSTSRTSNTRGGSDVQQQQRRYSRTVSRTGNPLV